MRCTIQTGPDGFDRTLTIECDNPPIRRTYRIDDKMRRVWDAVAKTYGAPTDPSEAVVGGWGDLFAKARDVTRRAVRSTAIRDIASVAKRVAPLATGVIPGGEAGVKAYRLLTAAKKGSMKARRRIVEIKALAQEDPRAAQVLDLLKQIDHRMRSTAAAQAIAAPQATEQVRAGGPFRTPSRWLFDQVNRPGATISARALYSRGLGQKDRPLTSAIDFARDSLGL